MKFDIINAKLAAGSGIKFGYDPTKFFEALSAMGKGMLGIFIVTGIIILSVMLLNKFTSGKKDK